MNPCVKFYRNIVDWKWFHVPEMVQLIMYFVCKADHEPYYVDGVLIERGKVCIPRKEICSELAIGEQTYKTCIKRLINDRKIVTSNELFRIAIITVLDFSRYIVEDHPNVQAPSKPKEPPQPDPQSATVSALPNDAPTIDDAVVVGTDSLFIDEIVLDDKPESKPKKKVEVDCDFIVRLYHDRCPSLPRVLKLTDKRKMKIRVRFEEMKFSYETLQEVFDKCEASYFMRGDNKRGWKADFDWIFTNSQNWVKVLEGKYDNQPNIYNAHGTAPIQSTPVGYGATQSERNAANSARQKCDILSTLAKCQQDYDAGNLPALTGIEANL
ncbi:MULTISPECIES: hypothetical protein [Bacteroidales]|uniref:hypothetical protein n=1 Tax=Bacteroidales TaxID=171549 RepID=UPI000F481D56|nr:MULTISPECIES: hypothetical protein [Bacteroidales]ROT14413.1 hypothetical protein EEL50_07995 [Muribaculaceae bacterium Isolate-105 (HZI)]